MYDQLLKIRQKHYETAQTEVASCRGAEQDALKALQEAKRIVKNFAQFRRKEIIRLYNRLIGKKISIKKLQDVRFSESVLDEKLAKLKFEVKEGEENVEKAKQLLAEAKQRFIFSQKELAKAEEIYDQMQAEKQKIEIRVENNTLDEFGTRRRGLPALSSVLLVLSLLSSLLFSSPSFAQEETYYRALGEPLSVALQDIADHFGLALKMTGVPNRKLTGEYKVDRPAQSLTKISKNYKLDWFIKGKTLYITPRSQRKKSGFTLKNKIQLNNFYAYLMSDRKLVGTNFPIKRNSKKYRLIVSAPDAYRAYVATVYRRFTSSNFKKPPTVKRHARFHKIGNKKTGYSVMVFSLEHAWAADKKYKSADSSYEVSGIATILRELTGGKGKKKSSAQASAAVADSVQALTPVAATHRDSQDNQSTQDTSPPSPSGSKAEGAHKVVILADERLNAVLIYDDVRRYDYYKGLINHLDRKVGLVEIEAMIVDVAKNHINELGINWRVTKGRDSIGFGSLSGDLAQSAVGLSLGAGGLGTALASNLGGVLARINLLEDKGESRIISRPSIITMDNLEAVINTTQRFFVKVEGYQDSSLYPVEFGTTLRVTPHIISPSSDNHHKPHIRLVVRIEDGTIDQSAMVDGLPSIQENKVSTQAVIEQGESLLIGGHIHKTKSNAISQVPILGQIPLIGYLFRSESIIEKEFIRLFIIKPRVYD